MAGRIRNRRARREQADQIEQSVRSACLGHGSDTAQETFQDKGSGCAECEKNAREKAPPRLCARWGVFDSGMKQVAIFDVHDFDADALGNQFWHAAFVRP